MNEQFDHHDAEKAPELRTGSHELPFSVPDGFFEEFPDSIRRRLDLLEAKPQQVEQPGFRTPDRYFEGLEDAIRHRIHGRMTPGRVWWRQAEWSLSFAALLLCLFLGTHTYFQPHAIGLSASSEPISVDDVSEALDYLDLDPATVASLLPASEESANTEQEVSQYLLDNDIDLSLLEL